MLTRIERINARKPERPVIERAAELLRGGGLVAFPTETVYGLGACALLPEAAGRVCEAKGRPPDNPLTIHIADFDALFRVVRDIPPQAEALAEAFWPGPLTMILPKGDEVPYETTGGLDTVAVRMPDHPVALALIRAAGGCVAAPSANLSGRPAPTTARHVADDLAGRIPLILDAGAVAVGIESTILDLSCLFGGKADGNAGRAAPPVLRPGSVTEAMLEKVVGPVCGVTESSGAGAAPPGMKYKHYAPKGELTLFSGSKRAVADRINSLAKNCRLKGEKAGVICSDGEEGRYRADTVLCIGSGEDEAARRLYAVLREFDRRGVDRIYSECFSACRVGEAVTDRLQRAADGRIIICEEGRWHDP